MEKNPEITKPCHDERQSLGPLLSPGSTALNFDFKLICMFPSLYILSFREGNSGLNSTST